LSIDNCCCCFFVSEPFSHGCARDLFSQTERRPRPWSPRPRPIPRRWQFKPKRDLVQGLQSSRPRRGRGVPTPRRDRAELKCYQAADIFVVHDEKLFSGMCKRSNHCLICCLVNVTLDTILGTDGILINWFLIILVLLDVALLLVCCLIHCKHLRLSDVNKYTYLLTYCASRRPRDRGVKTEATSHIHIIPRTDVVLKRSGGSLELRLNRSGIFKHNFVYVLLKCQGCARGLFSGDRGVWNFNGSETEPRNLLRLETASRPRRQDRGHIPGIEGWVGSLFCEMSSVQ